MGCLELVATFAGLWVDDQRASALGQTDILVAVFPAVLAVGQQRRLVACLATATPQSTKAARVDGRGSDVSGHFIGLLRHKCASSSGVLAKQRCARIGADPSSIIESLACDGAARWLVCSTSDHEIAGRHTVHSVGEPGFSRWDGGWLRSLPKTRWLFERHVRELLRKVSTRSRNASNERRMDRGFSLRHRYVKAFKTPLLCHRLLGSPELAQLINERFESAPTPEQ